MSKLNDYSTIIEQSKSYGIYRSSCMNEAVRDICYDNGFKPDVATFRLACVTIGHRTGIMIPDINTIKSSVRALEEGGSL